MWKKLIVQSFTDLQRYFLWKIIISKIKSAWWNSFYDTVNSNAHRAVHWKIICNGRDVPRRVKVTMNFHRLNIHKLRDYCKADGHSSKWWPWRIVHTMLSLTELHPELIVCLPTNTLGVNNQTWFLIPSKFMYEFRSTHEHVACQTQINTSWQILKSSFMFLIENNVYIIF